MSRANCNTGDLIEYKDAVTDAKAIFQIGEILGSGQFGFVYKAY